MHEALTNTICLINQKLHLSQPLALILETLSCLQILQLIFETMTSSASIHESILLAFTKNLPFFTAAFTFNPFSSLSSLIHPVWYLLMLYLAAHALLILITILIFRYKQSFKMNILNILGFTYTIHSRILFFPIHYFCLTLINLYKDKDPDIIAPFYYKTAWLAFTIIFLLGNLALAVIKEYFLYQITKSKDHYAVKTNSYHQIVIFYKIAMSILLILARDVEVCAEISSILHLLLNLALMYTLYRGLPFYKFKVLKTAVVMTAINFSISIIGILQAFVGDYKALMGLQIFILVLPILCVKIFLGIFKDLLARISVMRINSPNYAVHFILLMKEACLENEISQYQDKSFLPEKHLIIGYFSRNNINLFHMKNPLLSEGYELEVYTVIINKLEEIYRTHSKNELLLSFIVKIYLKKFGNIAKGTEYLKRMENIGYSVHVKSSVDNFHSQLEEMYNKEYLRDDDRLKLSKYFKYKNMANSIKTGLLKEVDKHLAFWEHLKITVIDMKEIVDIVEDIDSLYMQTQKRFHRDFDEFKYNFPLPILMYAVYLHSIRCLPYKADQLLKRFRAIVLNELTRNEFDTYSDTAAVVIISLDPRKAGLILDATGSIQNIFGVKKNEVIGFNFGSLFPAAVAKVYQQEVLEYAKSPTYKLDSKYKTYGKTGSGQIFELEAHFKLHSYGNREITIAIMCTKLSGPKSLFIANYSGHIVECSKDLEDNLQKEKLRLGTFRCMQDIAFEFDVVNLAFNQIYDTDDYFNQTTPRTTPNTARKTPKTLGAATSIIADNDGASRTSARPFFNNNADIIVSVSHRDEEPELHMTGTSRKLLQKSFGDRSYVDHSSISLKTNNKDSSYLDLTHKDEIKYDKARRICDKFIQGRKIILMPTNSSALKKKAKVKANVRIRPLVLNKEVHKVVFMTNIHRENTSFADLDNDSLGNHSQESPQTMSSFADAFPNINEDSPAKKSPNLVPHQRTSLRMNTPQFAPAKAFNFELEPINLGQQQGGIFMSDPRVLAEKRKSNIIRDTKPQDDNRSSVMDFTYKEVGAMKALKRISSSKKMSAILKTPIILVYLIVFCIMTLAAVSMAMTRSSIKEVDTGIQIVDMATRRLFYVQQCWQFTTLLFGSGLGIGTYSAITLYSMRSALTTATNYLVSSNSQMKELLTKLDAKDLIHETFTKDIWLYNNYGTNILRSEMEIFTTTDLLVTKYEPVITQTNLTLLARNSEIPFTLNNTANYYLMKMEKLNNLTHNFLEETIASNINGLKAILATQGVALFFLTVALIMIPFVIVKAYKRLFKALVKIGDNHIHDRLSIIKNIKTLFNEDIEEKSFIFDAYGQFEDNIAKPSHLPRKSKMDGAFHTVQRQEYSMAKMNKYLIKLELSALVFIPIFIGLFVASLNKSINTFKTFNEVNTELGVMRTSWYQSNMFLGSFAYSGIFLSKPTMLIKNSAPIQELKIYLEAFQDVNERLTRTFITGGKTDAFMEGIFKNTVCDYLSGVRYESACDSAAKGGSVGLLGLNEEYLWASNNYIGKFIQSPTLLTLLSVALPYINAVSGVLTVLNGIYPVILDHLFADFKVVVDRSLKRELEYFFGVLPTIIIYLVFIYFVPVRRLQRADFSRRKVLKIIPLRMIQENRIFSWYLVNEFQNEVPSIRRHF